MGFKITGTPQQGDIKKVSAAMDDVMIPRDQQVSTPVSTPAERPALAAGSPAPAVSGDKE